MVSSETENHREPVGAVLGLAQALLQQKQTQRARNQLKRVSRTPWTVEQASHLEKAWLLLAELFIQQGKQELAADLLRRVLEHNQVRPTAAYRGLGLLEWPSPSFRRFGIVSCRCYRAAPRPTRAWA